MADPSDPNWLPMLLPDNSWPWEIVNEDVDADLVSRDPIGFVLKSRRVFDCPMAWLPYLAAERSVNEYDGAWPEAQQRAVVEASFGLHQVQGTRPALDRALAPLGYQVKVIEWFERDLRAPYTFRLQVDLQDAEWPLGGREQVIRVANGAKSLHTKLETLELSRKTIPAVIYVGGLVVRRRLLRIRQTPVNIAVRVQSMVYVGAIFTSRRTIRVNPRP